MLVVLTVGGGKVFIDDNHQVDETTGDIIGGYTGKSGKRTPIRILGKQIICIQGPFEKKADVF